MRRGLARQQELFDLPGTVVFYDLTNVHFCGRPSSSLADFGRSRQKRHDSPLVTRALSLDGESFPRRGAILPGNVSEPGTLEEALEHLAAQAGPKADKPTVVMDAGLSAQENLKWLREQGYDWITVQRGKEVPPERTPDEQLTTRVGHQAKVRRLRSDSGELRLCLWSEERELKEEAMLARERFEEDLTRLHEGLSEKGRVKKHEKVLEKLGRLKERHRRVQRHYQVEVEPGEHGRSRAVRWSVAPAYAEKDVSAGSYLLRTSHVDWDLETVVRTYWQLTDLEATFRSLKSELGLRPIWHQETEPICAHLLIAVLAYHGVHWIRRKLAARGIRDSWAGVRRKLAGWARVQSTLKQADDGVIENWQDCEPSPEMREMAVAAGLEVKPRRRVVRSAASG